MARLNTLGWAVGTLACEMQGGIFWFSETRIDECRKER